MYNVLFIKISCHDNFVQVSFLSCHVMTIFYVCVLLTIFDLLWNYLIKFAKFVKAIFCVCI